MGLFDKDLPTNKKETHTSYLQIYSFAMYKNGQASMQKLTTNVLYMKKFTLEACPGKTQRIQKENDVRFKKE